VGGCYSIDGVIPVVHPDAFVHPDATLIGDVHIGPNTYIGPFASLRGDLGRIEVRAGANIQDGCILHCFPGRESVVDVDGHVGHGAVLHGCNVGPGTLIGIGSVLMDEVVVGARAFVGAHSFVKAGTQIPDGWLFTGTPAKPIRELTEDEMNWKANGTRVYQELAVRSRATLKRVEPLAVVEADRPSLSVLGERARPLQEYRAAAESS
jgi:phenylacetic acid degradation protein